MLGSSYMCSFPFNHQYELNMRSMNLVTQHIQDTNYPFRLLLRLTRSPVSLSFTLFYSSRNSCFTTFLMYHIIFTLSRLTHARTWGEERRAEFQKSSASKQASERVGLTNQSLLLMRDETNSQPSGPGYLIISPPPTCAYACA